MARVGLRIVALVLGTWLPGQSGMTMAAGNTFLKTGVKLGQPTRRKRLASSVNAASPEKRKAFAKDLKATIENLQGLLGDLDDNDDNDD